MRSVALKPMIVWRMVGTKENQRSIWKKIKGMNIGLTNHVSCNYDLSQNSCGVLFVLFIIHIMLSVLS